MKVWLLAVLAMASCVLVAPPSRSRFGPTVARIPEPRGEALNAVPGVYASIELLDLAPAYDPRVLGVGGVPLAIRLTSVALRPVRIAPLHINLASTHDGRSFSCREHELEPGGAPEPAWLEPGDSFVFERYIDCTTPLSGTYAIRVFARIGDSAPISSAGDYVGTFELEVADVPRSPLMRPKPPESETPAR